jgi:L-asparaginase II
MTNPVLVELTRGGLVESTHTGSVVLARPNGEAVMSLGEVQRPIFPRSAVKALQALPLIETGASDRYGFGDAELALACASHSGTADHASRADAMLSAAKLDAGALACGAHAPMHEASARALAAAGHPFTALHNNCSGKHSGMVCTCAHTGDSVAGYLDVRHPHQHRIIRAMADFCGDGFSATRYGIDGCSAPNWAVPVAHLATAFAIYISGHGLAAERRAATERITKACMARPDMVAGPDRVDTLAMAALPGKVFMKTGAEGVYCGAFPEHGLGFAIKIDDGNKRGAEAVVAGLIHHLYPAGGTFGVLGVTRNWVGTETGTTRLSADLTRQIERWPA